MLKGARCDDETPPLRPGDYSYSHGRWWLFTPNGRSIAVDPRKLTVTVHDDRSISIAEPILVQGLGPFPEYCGHLTRGSWSSDVRR